MLNTLTYDPPGSRLAPGRRLGHELDEPIEHPSFFDWTHAQISSSPGKGSGLEERPVRREEVGSHQPTSCKTLTRAGGGGGGVFLSPFGVTCGSVFFEDAPFWAAFERERKGKPHFGGQVPLKDPPHPAQRLTMA